jgi:hypothetical protein
MRKCNKTGRNLKTRNRLLTSMWTTEISGMRKGRKTTRKESFRCSKGKESKSGEWDETKELIG